MEETRLCNPTASTPTSLLELLQSGIDNSAHIAMRAVMFWPIKVAQEFIDAVELEEGQLPRRGALHLRVLVQPTNRKRCLAQHHPRADATTI
jgi:hypothetical protein